MLKKPRVTQLDGGARDAGVRPGMTAAQASAVCPGLRLYTANPADWEAGTAALSDVGFAFAPRVERSTDGEHLYFAVDDLAQLYPLGEQAIAQAVQAQAARLGLGARVAIASSKAVARVAARARELAIVPGAADAARAFLAPLPIELFCQARCNDDDGDDGAELQAAFRRWGTRTAGAVAALPVREVALRLGPAGAAVARCTRAQDDGSEPFLPQLPPDALEEAVELDYPIHQLEPLAFVLRGLVDRALARLAARSLACAGLTLRLTLDPRGLDVRTVPIAAPTREAKTLIELCRLDLARRPPSAAVVGARIVALPARVRATQLDILRPAGPAPDRLATTLARLAALVGPENVGAPVVVDSWREEAVSLAPYPAAPATVTVTPGCALTIRRKRPPEEIEVLMGRDGPIALHGKETTARVLVAAGPYRLSGEWWQLNPGATSETAGWAREYWDVHASDGAVYRLHRDGRDGRFYLDGYYD
jgi:protein ImuB